MRLQEHVALAPFTTFLIGGPARYFIEAKSDDDILEALAFARTKKLNLFILGAGSNVLVPDEGVAGVVLKVAIDEIECVGQRIVAGAGAHWDDVVDTAVARGLFGIENLAGIPGFVGGAIVQNIGAYGAELALTVEYVDAINRATGESIRFSREQAEFGYRTSVFKEKKDFIITHVALMFDAQGELNISYPDLVRAREAGVALATPREVAQAVRAIRTNKFPSDGETGTAGSFFKNPVISQAQAVILRERYSGLPMFSQNDGKMKISLAWLLDHALSLKGLTKGGARLYEKQPLVIVAEAGATSSDVDALARNVAQRVYDATGITIEREVETFGTTEK